MSKVYTLQQIKVELEKIKRKGFISIPHGMHRNDDGIVGQLLEKEFKITENNLSVSDLGTFELKGIRKRSSTLTLCHKTTSSGLTPIEIFNRFGYERESRRQKGVMKKKLFTTVKGTRQNNLGFRLKGIDNHNLGMYFHEEYICTWNLIKSLKKIKMIILAEAETQGTANSTDEKFHYVRAFLLENLKPLPILVENGIVVIDFCIDQVIGSGQRPHDRGPHIRVPKSKLIHAYQEMIPIL